MKQKLNYIGSKYSLLEFIDETIKQYTNNDSTFCDLFGGTNIVSRYFKNKYTIISNDMEYYSYVVAKTYISNEKIIKPYLLDYLNSLPVKEGIFTKTYCIDRKYFTPYNGAKIDTIRQEIEKMFIDMIIDEDEYYYYLTSLLESSDKVANTASIYSAYLKKIKKTAQKELVMFELDVENIGDKNISYQDDANHLIKKISGDILYLDPPYNHRQYGSNYHIYNTILKYDLDIIGVKGITGMREYKKSKYCSKVKVLETFEDLIKNANFKYIFISYNNEGLMNIDDMKIILEKYGKLKLHTKDYKTYKADSNRNNKSEVTQEYLWVLIK